MATSIKPELSNKNKYWIDKHRHYELKHFCLQYPLWKKEYELLGVPSLSSSVADRLPSSNSHSDPTAIYAMKKASYAEKIKLVEETVAEADRYLYEYLLKAVTEGLSYTYLKTRFKLPCGRDYYYERYRRFFWLLSNVRN